MRLRAPARGSQQSEQDSGSGSDGDSDSGSEPAQQGQAALRCVSAGLWGISRVPITLSSNAFPI